MILMFFFGPQGPPNQLRKLSLTPSLASDSIDDFRARADQDQASTEPLHWGHEHAMNVELHANRIRITPVLSLRLSNTAAHSKPGAVHRAARRRGATLAAIDVATWASGMTAEL
jgi:hypothetical protein